jgi:hypothetical protein
VLLVLAIEQEFKAEVLALDAGLGLLVGLILFFGLHRVFVWAMSDAWSHVSVVLIALVRGVPVLLIFLAFFSVVEEVWRIAEERGAPGRFHIMIGVLLGISFLYLVLDAYQELVTCKRALRSWKRARRAMRGADVPPELVREVLRDGSAPELELSFAQQVNGIAVLLVYEALIFFLVAVTAFMLFLGLGHLVMDPAMIREGATHDEWARVPFAWEPWTLVAGLMAAFSVLYLSVHVTAREQRQLFLAAPDQALHRSLAVLAASRYLERREASEAAPDSGAVPAPMTPSAAARAAIPATAPPAAVSRPPRA